MTTDTFAERDEWPVTKADLDRLEARLTTRIILAQVATAALLFTLLRVLRLETRNRSSEEGASRPPNAPEGRPSHCMPRGNRSRLYFTCLG